MGNCGKHSSNDASWRERVLDVCAIHQQQSRRDGDDGLHGDDPNTTDAGISIRQFIFTDPTSASRRTLAAITRRDL